MTESPWAAVGEITVKPTDSVVEVGPFDLVEGADTLWVRMTNTGEDTGWPWSYGVLSFKTEEGQPLGSIKAYNSYDGEVFRLGVGLSPSVRSGVLTFEPRGFNLAWVSKGNPWPLRFEAQSGRTTMTSSYWNRDPVNNLLTPRTANDIVRADVLQSGQLQNLFGGSTVLVDLRSTGQNVFYRPTNSGESSVIAVKSDVYGVGYGIFEISANGQISSRKTEINSICERRLKENIVPLDRQVAWDTIKTTPYYQFNYLGTDHADLSYGPMVDEVPPELRLPTGERDEKGMIHMLDNCLLQARLYAAVQLALERIEKLEAALASR